MKLDELLDAMTPIVQLKFTPLEFETRDEKANHHQHNLLKFTPLEFETKALGAAHSVGARVKIYSVGV